MLAGSSQPGAVLVPVRTAPQEYRMSDVVSTDPRTGEAVEVVAQETTTEEVDRLCAAALAAAPALEGMGRAGRVALLGALADALEARREDVVAVADRETGLGTTRLNGELTRTTYQLRLFGEVLTEGSYLEATIDHPGDTAMGPRPDLRRMLLPIGPVAVFGASNFPLAFSVPGGDTASALAAGCPVVVKAHGSHPATSQLVFDVLVAAARAAGAPEGTLGIVHGVQAGADLVAHPAIRAVGFTGSVTGGKALLAIIESRPDPVPFFGELSSLNPLVVTPRAAEERGAQIGAELVGSFTLGAGQFCTKPGLAFVPTGPAGDAVLDAMAEAVRGTDAPTLLNEGIAGSYERISSSLAELPGVETVARGGQPEDGGFRAAPLLLTTSAADLPSQVTEECFGPVAVVARYADEKALFAALEEMPSSLTATVLRGQGETDLPLAVSQELRARAGRLVYDAYPTGVAVSWAQHHGGPWPSTNSQHTSVGTSAIRRFLRPVTWQGAPAEVLPQELTDDYTDIPRRIDGVLRLPLG
jgi:NADP-dependent aldehyde dehydrogenase